MTLYGVAVKNKAGFHIRDYWHVQACWFESKEKAESYCLTVWGENPKELEWKIVEIKTV